MHNYSDIDKDLIKLLQSDEEKAIELLFKIHYSPLCKRVNRIINDTVASEDIVQDVFYIFWEKRSKIKVDISVGAYLNRMAMNAAFTYLRKIKNVNILELNEQIAHNTKESKHELGDEKYMFKELQEKVCSIIESLPPKCKLVFTMSRFEEMSNQQIADHLSISIKTVENQMTKALRIFRTRLLVPVFAVIQIGMMLI